MTERGQCGPFFIFHWGLQDGIGIFVIKQVWYLTFDPLTMGQRAGSLWTLFHLSSRTTRWHRYFCNISKFGIWTFFYLWPLNHGSQSGVTAECFPSFIEIPTRWHRYFNNISKFDIWPCLTFDPLTTGHRAGSLWTLFHLSSRTTRWHRYFLQYKQVWYLTPRWPQLTFWPQVVNRYDRAWASGSCTKYGTNTPFGWWDMPFLHIN